MRAYLVYNPFAGRYPSWILAEQAVRVFTRHGWAVQVKKSQSGEAITRLAQQAAAEEMDAFIVIGGDGSLNFAVKGLLNSRTALGVLPAGTANVWAQELGLPGLSWTRWLALEESANRLTRASVHAVDVGLCNDKPFLLWAGVGLDAFIVHRIEPRQRWEKHLAVAHYAATSVWSASQWHGMNLRVYADGREISGHFLLGVMSNVRLYAGGYATLSPNAQLDDGMMDLWLFKGDSLADTVNLALELLAGSHRHSEKVEYVGFNHLRLESDQRLYLQLDGEPLDLAEGVDIRVQTQALRVLVPESAPAALFSRPSLLDLRQAGPQDGAAHA